jgi:hypothetical protein
MEPEERALRKSAWATSSEGAGGRRWDLNQVDTPAEGGVEVKRRLSEGDGMMWWVAQMAQRIVGRAREVDATEERAFAASWVDRDVILQMPDRQVATQWGKDGAVAHVLISGYLKPVVTCCDWL